MPVAATAALVVLLPGSHAVPVLVKISCHSGYCRPIPLETASVAPMLSKPYSERSVTGLNHRRFLIWNHRPLPHRKNMAKRAKLLQDFGHPPGAVTWAEGLPATLIAENPAFSKGFLP
jgi:hypothetical protein